MKGVFFPFKRHLSAFVMCYKNKSLCVWWNRRSVLFFCYQTIISNGLGLFEFHTFGDATSANWGASTFQARFFAAHNGTMAHNFNFKFGIVAHAHYHDERRVVFWSKAKFCFDSIQIFFGFSNIFSWIIRLFFIEFLNIYFPVR